MSTFNNKTVQDLLETAKKPGKGGQLTQLGHALQKHANRTDSAFSGTKGSELAWNQKGKQVLEEILNDPGAIVENNQSPFLGNVVDIIDSTGKGPRFSLDMSEFIGF